MAPTDRSGAQCRISEAELRQRRGRDLAATRLIQWPYFEQKSVLEDLIVDDIDEWGMDNNSTKRLSDLNLAQVKALGLLSTCDPQSHHGAYHNLNDEEKLKKLKTSLTAVLQILPGRPSIRQELRRKIVELEAKIKKDKELAKERRAKRARRADLYTRARHANSASSEDQEERPRKKRAGQMPYTDRGTQTSPSDYQVQPSTTS